MLKVPFEDNTQRDVIRLLQITDSHLFADSSADLLSVPTAQSFSAVVEAIEAQGEDFDYILATGDISQDHSEASYRRFLDGVSRLNTPCFWLPGNHDDQPIMNALTPSDPVLKHTQLLLGDNWQIVLLDSQVVGVPYGQLSQAQLEHLQRCLAEHPQRHALVVLHHHPLHVGSQWLDEHALKHSEQFWQVIEQFEQVRAVLTGHVHQESQFVYQDVQVMTSPSTCVQFKPNSKEFALDNRSPGWRTLSLHRDGLVTSDVHRLPDGLFLPDFSSGGY